MPKTTTFTYCQLLGRPLPDRVGYLRRKLLGPSKELGTYERK
ncbi:MAG: hypothetical protein O3B25_08035 [Verrucomicrobia bacterium]|nr:hypothetical protein [Verrucomicrobiota bacterium]